jgi:hypothetical protein
MIFFAYAAIGVLKFLLSIALSSNVEAKEKQKPTQQQGQPGGNDETRPLLGERNDDEQPQKKRNPFSFLGEKDLVSLVIRLFILFALDSFASGLASLYVPIAIQVSYHCGRTPY